MGPDSPPFCAEMSGNHNQSLDRALQIVDAAAEAGAHHQTSNIYADTITLNSNREDFQINDEIVFGPDRIYTLYSKAYTPWEWHKPIIERAALHGMVCFTHLLMRRQ